MDAENQVDIQFLGAAQEVTGSCYLLQLGDYRVLVECGLIQGSPQDEARNSQPFPFEPASIDAVLLTHAHLDHSGRIPQLIKAGYRGHIYTHHATRDLCRIMLRDSAFINEKDTQYENRKHLRKHMPLIEPLYTMEEAEVALTRFVGIPYNEKRELLPGLTVCLRDAGHILGSASMEVWLTEPQHTRKIVFSGDLGHQGAPILQAPTFIEETDLLIMESTYGDRNHRSWEATWDELGEIIQSAKKHRGNILIPAFAVGRTQELLYMFKQNYEAWELNHWQIFLDSPMAIEATETYEKHHDLFNAETTAGIQQGQNLFDLPNLTFTPDLQQSMMLNTVSSGAIIIAGSGMCTGGRIRHHLQHHIAHRGCHVIIVGFQARSTLGRRLVDGAKTIQLWDESIPVNAQIHTVGGLSAHADQQGLVEWYQHFKQRPTVALVHGETQAIHPLSERLRKECHATVVIPERGMRLPLG